MMSSRASRRAATSALVARVRLMGLARPLPVDGNGRRVPDTGQNTLMLPMCALSAPRQRKPLESHDLDTTARVHHGTRRRGSVAAGGARTAAGDAGDRVARWRGPRIVHICVGRV